MKAGARISSAIVALALAACGGEAPVAQAPGGPAPAAAAAAGAGSAELEALMASADPKRGKILYMQCRACHALVPESEPGKIGPTLYGVIGRPAGTAPGYNYSDAVMKSGITWTAEEIDKWLQRPSEYLPGNKMVFVGIQDPQDRASIIAYIQQETALQAAQ